MKVSTRLYLLVFAALAPMALFAAAAALMLVQQEREYVARDTIGRARGAMSAVDAHLRGSVAALETLASYRPLERGDIAAFHAESQRVLRTQPGWVNIGLSKADKTVLANAVYALGQPEPPASVDDDSFEATVRDGRPRIGSVAAGTVVRSPTVRVRVPVAYGDEVRYVISAPLSLKHVAGLLEAQHLPEDWVIALVDREKRVIARLPALPAGVDESENLREASGEDTLEGWFRGRTRDGRAAYTGYVTSQLSGWTLAISVPASTVEAGSRRTVTLFGTGVFLTFAIGLLLAWHTARRLSP